MPTKTATLLFQLSRWLILPAAWGPGLAVLFMRHTVLPGPGTGKGLALMVSLAVPLLVGTAFRIAHATHPLGPALQRTVLWHLAPLALVYGLALAILLGAPPPSWVSQAVVTTHLMAHGYIAFVSTKLMRSAAEQELY